MPLTTSELPFLKGLYSLFGEELTNIIQTKHVCIIGIGGIGSWVAESFARTGVGEITLIDLDDICASNINRQIHSLHSNIGQLKVEVLKNRLIDINPHLKVNSIKSYLSEKNISDILNISASTIIDACDDFTAKLLLAQNCYEKQRHLLIFGAAGGKVDPSQIKIGDLTEATNDRLLARLRKKLRQEYHFPRKGKFQIQAVWSNEKSTIVENELDECLLTSINSSKKLDCFDGFGSVSFLTGSMAFFGVYSVIKYWEEEILK